MWNPKNCFLPLRLPAVACALLAYAFYVSLLLSLSPAALCASHVSVSIYRSVCLRLRLVCPSVSLSICRSVCVCVGLFVCLYAHVSIYPSVCDCLWPCAYLRVSLSLSCLYVCVTFALIVSFSPAGHTFPPSLAMEGEHGGDISASKVRPLRNEKKETEY